MNMKDKKAMEEDRLAMAREAFKDMVLHCKQDRPLTPRRYGRIERGEVTMTCWELLTISEKLGIHPYMVLCERQVGNEELELLNNFLLLLEKGKEVPVLPFIADLINSAAGVCRGSEVRP